VTDVTFTSLRAALAARIPVRIDDPVAAQAAVALVLTQGAGDLAALFIRRAEVSGDPWSGHMALPGGRRHAGDRDLLMTAIRETREETGIELEDSEYLGELDDFTPRTPSLPRIVVRPHVFGLKKRPEITLSDEVAGFIWLTISELRGSYQEVEVQGRESTLRVQGFVSGPNIIWVLTERIVSPFIDLLQMLK